MRAFYLLLMVMILGIILMVGCSKKEESQTGALKQNEDVQVDQSTLIIKPKAYNYDSLRVVIAALLDVVKANPDDINARQQLVATCYDTTWETIVAPGIGKRSQQPQAEAVAEKQAEQAAIADAYRWAMYIKKWRHDPTTPDFGSISGEIRGGRVVSRQILEDQTVSILMEIKSSDIP
ncbi:MAG: hypothetical protein ONB16_13440 [candidate division KSB1 bacterium]|nr:hypothetical protein [candidate division KSB1 bacterium]MDZ7318452.1 hypothetical protein [candidate division KSB1 bacterium]MDZ7340074.1 hypothetical protein [candidate division KSB1 bacterium]